MHRFFDPAGSAHGSRKRRRRCCLPRPATASAPRLMRLTRLNSPACAYPYRRFAAALADGRRTARGHRGSLVLRCRAFSSPSPGRFIPALSAGTLRPAEARAGGRRRSSSRPPPVLPDALRSRPAQAGDARAAELRSAPLVLVVGGDVADRGGEVGRRRGAKSLVLFRRPPPEPGGTVSDHRALQRLFVFNAVGLPGWMLAWQAPQTTRVLRRRFAMTCTHSGGSGCPGLLSSASLRIW